MTDLERARAFVIETLEKHYPEIVAEALAAARREGAEAALRAALPAGPEPECFRDWWSEYGRPGILPEDAYRALRAHLLGEDA